MKNVSSLLREADPLNDESHDLDDQRQRMRRTVMTAASVAEAQGRPLPARRVVLGAVAAFAAALIAVSVLVGPADRGTLQAAVRLEVRLAEAQPAPGLIVARVANSPNLVYLHPEIVATNDDIAQSWVTQDGPDRFSVSVELFQAGAERMRHATATHIGRPVAILIDGQVAFAPVVRSAISGSAVISGGYTQAEAQRIADGVNSR